jgi:CAAX protease family protein
MIARILLSADEFHSNRLRLRAGWRILGQLAIMIFITAAMTWIFSTFAPPDSGLSVYGLLVAQISSFIAINLSVFLARRFLDRRSITSLGLQTESQAIWDLLVGFLIAGVMMLAIYLIEDAAGWLTFRGLAWSSIEITNTILLTSVMLVIFLIVGWQEELLSRGYQLQNIAEGLTMFWGIVLSSLFFAMGHLLNPNMNFMAVSGLFLAGIFLSYAYLRTQQLWLPIGLHIGWNFFESTIFGFPVSGLELFRLIEHSVNGPVLYTGGAFGPEAGLVLLPALALGTILVYYYTRLGSTQRDK